jgi:hypothetical protein
VTLTATGLTKSAPARTRAGLPGWLWTASLAAAGAGVLHVAAAVEHREGGQLVVALFLVAAMAQWGLAWLLAVGALSRRRPGAWTLTAAVVGTLALVVLFVVAHTTDLLAGLTGHAAGHDVTAAGGHGEHAGAAEPQGHSVVTEGAVALSAEPQHVVTPPGLLGTATVALELLCAIGLTALLPRTWRSWALNAQLALGALAWVLWLTGVLG